MSQPDQPASLPTPELTPSPAPVPRPTSSLIPMLIPTIRTSIPFGFQDNDHQYDPNIKYNDRVAVRAVLRYPLNQEIAMIYCSSGTFWRLPGSQIEDGEDHGIALARIMMEETGCDIDPDIGAPFLKVEGWCKDWGVYIHETSYCYPVKVKGLVVEGRQIKRFCQISWGPVLSMKSLMERHADRCTSAWGRFSLFRDLNIMSYYTSGVNNPVFIVRKARE
ncbi:hypothetical protein BKA64DRAFT_749986 [Cadophora sp. MPI-SDFR-AT-0126]|nr:hypothetical protein BKA64DRAFT_749986 [Leotiomycetes sp. MPI-SDFR-AT-0126]